MRCDKCKHWDKLDASTLELGRCRINSPSLNGIDPFGLALWPKTKHTDWCGDFWEDDGELIETLYGGERRSATLDFTD
jgi:hypothetical protein